MIQGTRASRARDELSLPPVNGVAHGARSGLYNPNAPPATWDPSSATLSKPTWSNSGLDPVAEKDLVNDPRYRDGAATPPPTPEEAKFLADNGGIPWDKLRSKEFWLKKKTIIWTIVIVILIAGAVVFGIEKDKVIKWFQPIGNKIKSWPAGWLIPIGVLFILSFPPLFGHEFILLLIGIIWGVWEGFGIAAAGTILGEVANFYAFKYCLTSRAIKYEEHNLQYAAFAELVRRGSFRIILAARYSLIPGHLTTAIFAACQVGITVFILSAFLSLPKQLALVYVGVAYQESGSGTASGKSKAISAAIIVVTSIITVFAMRYMRQKMDPIKEEIVYRRRKARQAKLAKNGYASERPADSIYAPQPRPADTNNSWQQQYAPPYASYPPPQGPPQAQAAYHAPQGPPPSRAPISYPAPNGRPPMQNSYAPGPHSYNQYNAARR